MRHRALPFVLLATLTVGCASGGASSAATTADGAASAAAPGGRVVATIVGVSGGRLAGTLTLTPGSRSNETRARVTLLNAPSVQNVPWIIRQGQCGEPGPEVGPMASYRRILTRADGSAETSMTLPIALPSGGVHHVRILSPSDGQTTIGCGMLTIEG